MRAVLFNFINVIQQFILHLPLTWIKRNNSYVFSVYFTLVIAETIVANVD